MKINSRLNAVLIIVAVFISGCVVQSKQLNTLINLTKDPKFDISDAAWTLRYSGYESIVYAISTENGILFSNNSGDQVLFDGWVITDVIGVGRSKININISDADGIRVFKKGVRQLSRHFCGDWDRLEKSDVIRYSQSCESERSYQNIILVGEDENVSLIRQIIDEKYSALTLSKLN